jgi:asparagine synthase (glutamine-hydrolysing)
MCGIAGVLDTSGRKPERRLVQVMLDRLVHRGPDDEGCNVLGEAVLGMRRLSILDPTPQGHQPMQSPDGRYWLVHNGEIYNFLELADELIAEGIQFRTKTDTEVILAAYAAWGPDCVKRFNGIWAFAIFDSVERSLFLARDHFGVKPLFLAEGSGTIAFASEIKALQTLPWVSDTPDQGAVFDYLVDGSVDRDERTFFRDIRRFPAAHWLLVTSEGRTWDRYWTPTRLAEDPSFRPAATDAELTEQFRSLLIDAVALQLQSDVPIGSCLSGGIDSSSIVSIAAGLRNGALAAPGRIHREREATPHLAFFAEFREAGIDERPFVDAVVAQTGISLHTTSPTTADFLETIDDVVRAQDEPFGSLSILAQYHVMRIARQAGVKVLLDGQGADELLGGYRNYAGFRYAGALRSGDPRTLAAAGRHLASGGAPLRSSLGYAAIGLRPLPPWLIRGRMPAAWIGPEAQPDPAPNHLGNGRNGHRLGTMLGRKLWWDMAAENLPGLLRFEDRNSMAFGIEARVPFLDVRLVEAALALPDRLKIEGDQRKIVLRRAMQGVVPPAVLERRDKVAFQPPQARYLRESAGRWRALAPHPVAEAAGFLRSKVISNAIDGYLAGRISADLLWRALNLELWLRS